jgi:hypothetical protein
MTAAGGRTLVAFPVFRRPVAQTTPAPVARLFCIPGLSGLGDRAYGRVDGTRGRVCPRPSAAGARM